MFGGSLVDVEGELDVVVVDPDAWSGCRAPLSSVYRDAFGSRGWMRRFRIVHALAQCLWIIPSLGLLSGILLSLVTVAIDRRNENQLLSQSIVGNAADAQSILTTTATGASGRVAGPRRT